MNYLVHFLMSEWRNVCALSIYSELLGVQI